MRERLDVGRRARDLVRRLARDHAASSCAGMLVLRLELRPCSPRSRSRRSRRRARATACSRRRRRSCRRSGRRRAAARGCRRAGTERAGSLGAADRRAAHRDDPRQDRERDLGRRARADVEARRGRRSARAAPPARRRRAARPSTPVPRLGWRPARRTARPPRARGAACAARRGRARRPRARGRRARGSRSSPSARRPRARARAPSRSDGRGDRRVADDEHPRRGQHRLQEHLDRAAREARVLHGHGAVRARSTSAGVGRRPPRRTAGSAAAPPRRSRIACSE